MKFLTNLKYSSIIYNIRNDMDKRALPGRPDVWRYI